MAMAPLSAGLDAEQRQREFGPPRAEQPGYPQNLAFIEIERNVGEVVSLR